MHCKCWAFGVRRRKIVANLIDSKEREKHFMFENIFASLRGFFSGIASGVVEFFGSVANAVAGLGLLPLAGLIGALLNVAINAICNLMSLAGQSTIGLFSLNIGSGVSIFEVALGWSDDIGVILKALALTLLAIIFFSQLVRLMMAPPTGQDDTPLGLIARTVASGLLISFGPQIVITVEQIFAVFFTWALDIHDISQLDFSGFATAAQLYIQGGGIDIAATAQIASIATSVLLLVMVIMIAGKFLTFMFEVAQRYVVLGILIFSSPLAFMLMASKSTRNSFASWIRMVGSQFFLLVSNAIFLNVFFKSFAGFTNTLDIMLALDDYAAYNGISVVLLWCISMYAILYIAAKLDTYLNTIGLSTAETGGSMMSTIMSEIIDGGLAGPMRSAKRSGSRQERRGDNARPSVFNRITGKSADKSKSQAVTLDIDRSGSATTESINKVVANKAEARGAELGRGVLSTLSGVPARQVQRLNPQSAVTRDGVIYLTAYPGKAEQPMSVAFVQERDIPKTEHGSFYGRKVFIGNTPYIAMAKGLGAKEFNVSNPAMRSCLEERFGEQMTVAPLLAGDGKVSTGAWRQYASIPGDKGVIIHEWTPASCYGNDAGLNATVERIGSLDYMSYDVILPYVDANNPAKGVTSRCAVPLVHTELPDQKEWFTAQFPSLLMDDIKSFAPAQIDGAIMIGTATGAYTLAPAAEYGAGIDAQTLLVEAANGARYILVEGESEQLFQRIGISDNGPYALGTSIVDNDLAGILTGASEIVKTAMKKRKGV